MSDERYDVVILPEYCKGCGLCIELCPVRKLRINPAPNSDGIQAAEATGEADCVGCRQCAIICPDAAVRIVRIEPAGATSAGAEDAAD
jgi:2-oxoglutarate ferredoxin oxidoreductase subunit delta